MRNPIALLLVAIVAAAVAYTLWTWRAPQAQAGDPWQALPAHTAVVIEVPEALPTWNRLVHTGKFWSIWSEHPAVHAAGTVLDRILGHMEQQATLRDAWQGQTALVALMRSGGGAVGMLFTGALPTGAQRVERFADVLQLDADQRAALASERTVIWQPDTALAVLHIHVAQGLWLISPDLQVMEDALLELKSPGSILDDPLLAQMMATRGDGTDAHVILHTARAHRLLEGLWTPKALEQLTPPAGWCALDLRVRPDALLLSGLMAAEPSAALDALRGQGQGPFPALRVLPARIAWSQQQHIADPMAWLEARGTATDTLAEALFGWVKGSIGTAQGTAPDGSDLLLAFLGTEDPDAAIDALQQLCVKGCDTLDHRGIRITQLPVPGAYERLLGEAWVGVERTWWAVLGDMVLLGDGPQAIQRAIDGWTTGGNLVEDPRASEWFARMGATAGSAWWCDLARAERLMTRDTRSDKADAVAELVRATRELGGFTLHVSPGQRGLFHITVGLQHAPLEERTSHAMWSVELGAPVSRAPEVVRDHVTQGSEILVQDAQHRIHMISSSGQVRWTRNLDGPLMGPTQQVDRYRNAKFQLLLLTRNTLYLIDRNGADVSGFPVKLPSPAVAPLALMDYENDRDYRILLPTENGRLLNFTAEGLPVKGWEPAPQLAAPAAGPVVHLRIKGKDLLVVADRAGKVYVLDRKGKPRERMALELPAESKVLAVLPGNEAALVTVVWRTAEGSLSAGTLGGDTRTLAELPGAQPCDLDRNGTPGTLTPVEGGILWSEEGQEALWPVPEARNEDVLQQLQGQGSGQWMVLHTASGGQLHLISNKGTLLESTDGPAAVGAPPADLDRDGRVEWVVISPEGRLIALPVQLPAAEMQ